MSRNRRKAPGRDLQALASKVDRRRRKEAAERKAAQPVFRDRFAGLFTPSGSTWR